MCLQTKMRANLQLFFDIRKCARVFYQKSVLLSTKSHSFFAPFFYFQLFFVPLSPKLPIISESANIGGYKKESAPIHSGALSFFLPKRLISC